MSKVGSNKNDNQFKMCKPFRYGFYGYQLEIPANEQLLSFSFQTKCIYQIKTDKNEFLVRSCHKCKRLLPIDQFYERKSPCKKCHIATVKAWEKLNPEKVKRYKRRDNNTYIYNTYLREQAEKCSL